MRNTLAILAIALISLTNLTAGRLDVAVIQFPEEKTVDELNAAFASQSLYEMTNSNRTMTKESYLKGGYVLFAQSLPASPGGSFSTATRIKDTRADIEGSLGRGRISVTIRLMEGIKAGLRQFEKTTYTGSGPLPSSAPSVISLKQTRGKAPSVIKGDTTVKRYGLTTVIVAQYTP